VKECTQNAICSTSVSQSSATTHNYIAKIEQSGGTNVQAQSGTVKLTWISASTGWTASLSTTQGSVGTGQNVTLTASTNQDVGPTIYYLSIVDVGSNTVVASCGSGTTCSYTASQSTASAHTYLAEIDTGSAGASVQAASGAIPVTWATATTVTTTPDGALVSERVSGATYYYLFDGLGSVVALTNSSGGIVDSYAYDPYGNATSVSETVSNQFRFIGAVWDSSTGLYKMGERYYDPSLGRFTQLDPLGGGYVYSHDDPINLSDPSGLSDEESSIQDHCTDETGAPADAPINPEDSDPERYGDAAKTSKIARGHAYTQHVVKEGGFRRFGVTNRAQFAKLLNNVVTWGQKRVLGNGARAYWKDGIVVIVNDHDPDGGTAYRRSWARFQKL
jgi:RHS repeat-associated protein